MATQISDHFTVDEFACHDGTPYPASRPDDEAKGVWLDTRLGLLVDTLEEVRAAAGDLPLNIDSGYRTPGYDDRLYQAHLAAVGDDGDVAPASRSQHPQGRAADVKHAKLSPSGLFNLILELYADGHLPHLGGLGLYPTFVHVDVRPRPGSDGAANDGHLAIWGGTRPRNVL